MQRETEDEWHRSHEEPLQLLTLQRRRPPKAHDEGGQRSDQRNHAGKDGQIVKLDS